MATQYHLSQLEAHPRDEENTNGELLDPGGLLDGSGGMSKNSNLQV